MRRLRELENALIRVESAVAVVLVLLTLMLASYNVVYRNVLVPLQYRWAHSGPPVEPAQTPEATPTDAKAPAQTPEAPAPGAGDDFGGFGGGLGDDEPADEASPGGAGDDFGGFGGGFGEDEPTDDAAEPEAKPEARPEAAEPEGAEPEADGGGFGGFGGGFGEDEPTDEPAKSGSPEAAGGDDFGGFGGGLGDEPAETGEDDFGGGRGGEEAETGEDDFGEDDLGDDDQFDNLPEISAVGQKQQAPEGPQGGPPPEGSFAAWAVDFIDGIKLDWIDVFLRQLVIIISFLGAMLATQRGKHINIDALSKVLPAPAQRAVAVLMPLFAVGICLMLASAGWDLVQISREFPSELLPFADDWHMQLMFPVGFGLLAVHFAVRVVEAIAGPPPRDEPRQSSIVTLVDEEYQPEPGAAGSVSKMVAEVEVSGEIAGPDDEGGPS